MSDLMGCDRSQQLCSVQFGEIGGILNPIEKNIGIFSASIFPEECFSEYQVRPRFTVMHNVQHKFIGARSVVAILDLTLFLAIYPLDLNGGACKDACGLLFRSSQKSR